MADLYEEFRQHGCRITSATSRGHFLVTMENRQLRVVVDVTKGGDLLELRHKPTDVDALARTPGSLAAPGTRIAPLESARGSFLDHSYLGWQEVLPNGGPPSTWGNAVFGTHGEASLLEWSARVLTDTPDEVAVVFWVDLARTPFRLERVLRIAADEPVLHFDETVTNLGGERLPLMWGHHPDFGAPLLAEGAFVDLAPGTVHTHRVDVPTRRLAPEVTAPWPMVPGVDGGLVDLRPVLPKESRADDSFYVKLDGEGWAAVRNPALDLGIAMVWDAEVFRYAWCWLTYGGSESFPHYSNLMNVAIEPFTSPTAPLADLAANRPDEVCWLDPGEQLRATLATGFFESASRPVRGDDPRLPSPWRARR